MWITVSGDHRGRSVAVMQPYLFPYIGYFQLMMSVDTFVIYDDVNFITRGWINRNRILINGKATLLTLPVRNQSQFRQIREHEFSDPVRSKMKAARSIELTYRRAPYFREFFPVLAQLVENDSAGVSTYLEATLRGIASYLGITTELRLSSDLGIAIESPGEGRIIKICEAVGASTYVNPEAGGFLYTSQNFSDRGIDLVLLRHGCPPYHQFSNEFVPRLSIIDVAMFNSDEGLSHQLGAYELLISD